MARSPDGASRVANQHVLDRRRLLAGGAVALGAWSAPAVVGLARAEAAGGSCVPIEVRWTGGFVSGGTYTISGTTNGVTVQAVAQPVLSSGASPQVFLSAGRLVLAMSNHQIGDYWNVNFSFSANNGTVCSAGLTVLDIDQNGRNLGCATNSRFRDELHNLYGAGLSVSPQGGLVQNPPGVWASSLTCKTTNTENLAFNWTVNSGVTGGGFSWIAGTPPGTSQTLDRQLILISPVATCIGGLSSNLPDTAGLGDPAVALEDHVSPSRFETGQPELD